MMRWLGCLDGNQAQSGEKSVSWYGLPPGTWAGRNAVRLDGSVRGSLRAVPPGRGDPNIWHVPGVNGTMQHLLRLHRRTGATSSPVAGLVVLLEQVLAEIAGEVAPHGVDVVGTVLSVVQFDEE